MHKKIQELNDRFRQTFAGGRIMLTQGIQSLGEEMITHLLAQLQSYDDFPEEGDPYEEHDFGIHLHVLQGRYTLHLGYPIARV